MNTVDEIRTQLLQLPPRDRAELARDLLLSLEETDFDDNVDAEWVEEIESRADAYERGDLTACDWRESVDRLRAALTKRRAS